MMRARIAHGYSSGSQVARLTIRRCNPFSTKPWFTRDAQAWKIQKLAGTSCSTYVHSTSSRSSMDTHRIPPPSHPAPSRPARTPSPAAPKVIRAVYCDPPRIADPPADLRTDRKAEGRGPPMWAAVRRSVWRSAGRAGRPWLRRADLLHSTKHACAALAPH